MENDKINDIILEFINSDYKFGYSFDFNMFWSNRREQAECDCELQSKCFETLAKTVDLKTI